MLMADDKLFIVGESGSKLVHKFGFTPDAITPFGQDLLVYRSGDNPFLYLLDHSYTLREWVPVEPEEGGDIPAITHLASDGQTVWGLSANKLVWFAGTDTQNLSQEKFDEGFQMQNAVKFVAVHSYLAEGFRSENDPVYLKYVAPLRAIKERANITYLFTYLYSGYVQETPEIRYMIDSTTTDEHATIGYLDEVDEEEAADLRRVYQTGNPKTGKIRLFPDWGLLKNGSAPIFDSAGKVSGLVGVDIDVDIINRKTRLALLWVMLSGVIVIIIALFVSYAFAKKVTSPLKEIRLAALKTAAGEYKPVEGIHGSKEIDQLTGRFTSTAALAKSYIVNLRDANLFARLSKIKGHIASSLKTQFTGAIPRYALSRKNEEYLGVAEVGSRILFWMIDEKSINYDTLKLALLRKEEVRLCLQAYPDNKDVFARVRDILECDFYLIDEKKNIVHGYDYRTKSIHEKKIGEA